MGIFSWLVDMLGKPVPVSYDGDFLDEYARLVSDIYVRELAFWSAVNISANALAKCEFRTYVNKKKHKGREYYLWNFEPNKNQNSSAFFHKLVAKLFRESECLAIEHNNQIFIADSFTKTTNGINEDVFTDVTVNDATFQRSFFQSEVLYFKNTEVNLRKVINGLYDSYSKLITYSMTAYQRSKGTKGIFKYKSMPVAGTEQRKLFDDLINNRIKTWLTGDNSALPLGEGQEWQELKEKTYTSDSTRDIRAMIDDIFDFTAKGLGIPPALMKGDVQDTSKAVDQLLTFHVCPLVDMICEEIVRKRYGYDEYSKGNYLRIDTKSIKHIDLLSVASSIDKLIGSGSFCINDIREALGEEPIEEPWASKHFITKNYEDMEQALRAIKGGDED